MVKKTTKAVAEDVIIPTDSAGNIAEATTDTIEQREEEIKKDDAEVQEEMAKTYVAKGAEKEEIAVPENKELVNKDALAKLIARIDKVEAENKDLKETQLAVADKSRLQAHKTKNAPNTKPTVRLNVWKGQVVTGWDELTKNLCEKNHLGRWVEELECNLHLEDGTKVENLPYVERIRHMENKDATILKKYPSGEVLGKDEIPQVMLDVITDDGKEYTIDKRYVN